MEMSERELAHALLTHLRAPETEKDNTFWAWERVEEMIDSGQVADAWRIIISAIEQAETERDLGLIGAGVLESLVVAHPDHIVSDLVAKAKASQKVARAARSMYVDDLSAEQVEAIRRAIDDSDA